MYLFFDTETNGLPKDFNADVYATGNWPRIVQIAWQHYDKYGNKLAEHNYIIYPHDFKISEESTAIHKITEERTKKEGVPIEYALKMFSETFKLTNLLVAHNASFDISVVSCELIRARKYEEYERMRKIVQLCTMKKTMQFCKLPGVHDYKWPKLSELYEKINGTPYYGDDMHNALTDVNILADCFFKLKERKII